MCPVSQAQAELDKIISNWNQTYHRQLQRQRVRREDLSACTIRSSAECAPGSRFYFGAVVFVLADRVREPHDDAARAGECA